MANPTSAPPVGAAPPSAARRTLLRRTRSGVRTTAVPRLTQRRESTSDSLLPLGEARTANPDTDEEPRERLLWPSGPVQPAPRRGSRELRRSGGTLLLPKSYGIQRAVSVQPAGTIQRSLRPLCTDFVPARLHRIPRNVRALAIPRPRRYRGTDRPDRLHLRGPAIRRTFHTARARRGWRTIRGPSFSPTKQPTG